METAFIVIFALAGLSFIGYVVYQMFFSKSNPNELTNLEKRYVDPALAERQKAELDAANALADVEAKVKGIVVKIDGKVNV